LNFGLVGEYGDSSSIVVDNALPKELIINDVISQGIAYNSGSASIDELLISGFIQYPNYENINNVRVYPSEGNGANTNEQGYYEMQFFGSGPFLSVTPYKNDPEPMNGYDMADVSAIHAYVDEPEISEITTAYQVIAADVDGDEAVEHEDADLLEMFLLGEADLPSHTLWRFVYSGHNFVDINNPYPYPDHFEAADYNTIVPGSRIDFVGLKRGDVNLSRDNTQVGRTHVSRTVTLEVNTTSFDDGITEVEVRSLDFGDVRAYQFTMSWDPNAFELLDNSLFSMGRHSGTQTSEGHITSTWQTPKAIKLTDGTTLISFMLLAKDQKATAQVSVTDAVTATHVFDASLAKLSVNVIQRVGSDEGQGVEIFPNPATSTARILIHSGHQQESSIEVSDLNGKAIYATTLMLQPGKNVLSVETEKWKKGVHLLRLRTKTRFEIKKVLKN
jgi:hypothetical protein